jgi:hypothetical protein
MRATRLRLSRQGKRKTPENSHAWTKKDDDLLRELYTQKGATTKEIADKLVRTTEAIETRLSALKMRRPKELWHYKHHPIWHADNFKVMQELTSP